MRAKEQRPCLAPEIKIMWEEQLINNAGLPDGIALRQGCQIIWLDVYVNTYTTIYHNL